MLMIMTAMIYESIKETRALRKLLKRDLETHQNWLFEQLYAIAPGKVLMPEELAPELKSQPAIITSPKIDPMSEFTGDKDDWHD
jgi:uncharacterized UBP type Zn finger protein